MKRPAAYANPYLAGIGVGIVMLLAYVLAGRGLGASGALTSVVAVGVNQAAPAQAHANALFGPYLPEGRSPLRDWLVFEIAGVAVGGFLSALVAGRVRAEVARGPRMGAAPRLLYAVGGGLLMGAGAKLARGCTSGLALNGGALLAVGAWIFIACAFAAGYLVAPLVRRQWT